MYHKRLYGKKLVGDGLISSDFGFGVIVGFNLANSERNFSVI